MSATGSTNHPLIPLSDENTAFAEAMGVNAAIHENDFIFHFVDRWWAADGGRERAVKEYFNLGRYTADLSKTMITDVQKVYEVPKWDWAPRRVLDFASGYGCTARHLRQVFPDSLCGTCDIHPDAVNFNKDILGVEGYLSSPVPEQLELPPQDVIFAHSFFSHMPETTWARWLKALANALAPRGVLIFTANGFAVDKQGFPGLNVKANGFGFIPQSEQDDLAGEEYGLTISYPRWVLTVLASIPELRLSKFHEGLWWGAQDAYVCVKEPDPAVPASALPTPPVSRSVEAIPRMGPAAAEEYIASLYATVLKRDPRPDEFANWVRAAEAFPPEQVYFAFVNSKEYKLQQQHAQIGVTGGTPAPGVPPGATSAEQEQGQSPLSRESTTDRTSRFVFLAPDGTETSLDPHSPVASARIQAIAAHLRENVPPGGAVGLLYRSEANLIIAWFAALVAGLRPLVMQYPTRKQSRAYWIDSVRNTVATAGLAGIVADDYCASLDLAEFPNPVAQAELDRLPDAAPGPVLPDDFTIIQLSSGTTGYRKAMEFTSFALRRHVADYNQALGLVPGEDRIASWLPLYHDMGYIACFVMPILLGIDVVMMDPMDWVKQPEMLVTAIERHQATVCYMPNFGFEVMARTAMPPLPSMRRWISCSEPVAAVTVEKFLRASGAPAETFCPCYAMAENLFAVSIGAGCRTAEIDGVEVVSCGTPIPGVELKIVEGEIWVRSPTSLLRYMGGDDIRDAEGFYPTGDLGLVIDGELYVSGRKHDLLIQAGKKFILSDVDLRLNELRPEVRGRAATLAVRDERLGTEMPTVLIEAPDFFERTDAAEIAAELKDATGLDQVEVAFVPPRFLTKTSSGKFNRRKSRADWIAAREWRNGAGDRDAVAEIRASFPGVAWDQPVTEVLDSLSLTLLRIILDASPVQFQQQQSLAGIVAALEAASRTPAEAHSEEGIRIVALSDHTTIATITAEHLDWLGQSVGCKVTLEHVCLPPSPVVFSDLIFHDYFQPRLDQAAFGAVSRAMAKLKQASVIVTDDLAEMLFLCEGTYPALSHNLERDPRADLISYRWQDYVQHHHRLPLTVVSGLDVPLGASGTVLDQMSRYLGIPIFRVARVPGFAEFTRDWEYQALEQRLGHHVDPDLLVKNLLRWAQDLPAPLARRELPAGERIQRSDLPHFCSHSVSREAVDRIVERYDRFCIAGSASSLPYLRRELDRAGKSYVQVPSYAQQILSRLDFDYDCLVICGAMGEPPAELDKPIIALQHIALDWRIRNLGEFAEEVGELQEDVHSGTDWLHLFALERGKDLKQWQATRVETEQEFRVLWAQAAGHRADAALG